MATSYEIKERSSALIVGVLKDENGTPLPASQIITLRATLYNLTTGTILNSRNAQDIKNVNGGSVDENGNFSLHLSAIDNIVEDTTIIGFEIHMLVIEWTYGASKTGKETYELRVENLSRYVSTPSAHTFLNYVDEVKLKVDDEKLTYDAIVSGIRSALTQYGKDKPFAVRKRVQGNGTSEYVLTVILGADFVHGSTRITEVEYPAGTIPRSVLDRTEWQIIDDGTAQDGSNLKLTLFSAAPSSTEYMVVEYTIQPQVYEKPQSGKHQNFPDTFEHFTNITMLAAANCCFYLSAAYAPSSDSTITADVVNHHDKSRKYMELARNYLKRYSQLVFGQEESETKVVAGYVEVDVDTSSVMGGEYLFHERRRRSL